MGPVMRDAGDTTPSGYDLERFVQAQQDVYEGVLEELRRGHKTGHWMWFVFPQIAGLGHSEMSRYYAIASLDEARVYLAHRVLGPRLRECAGLLLAAPPDRSVDAMLGGIDAIKLRSSMTLFRLAAPDEPVFTAVLERFYDGVPDPATEERLRSR